MKAGDEAVLSYASFYLEQMARAERVQQTLSELYKFLVAYERHELSLNKFRNLYWAWDEIDPKLPYLDTYGYGARLDNIEQLVVAEAKVWITMVRATSKRPYRREKIGPISR